MLLKYMLLIFFNLNVINLCPNTNHFKIDSQRFKIDQETISDFDEFSQLNFTTCGKSSVNITTLRLKPRKKIILDDSLDLNGYDINIISSIFTVILSNLKGIDLSASDLKNLKALNYYDKRAIFWHIELSNFDFYMKNKLIDSNKCNFENLYSDQITSFMTGIYFLFLGPLLIYSGQTCPLIFHNTIIQTLVIHGIGSSFINKNIFAFTQLPSK